MNGMGVRTSRRATGDRATDMVDLSAVRAVLFDLDGTLYGQALIRTVMAAELLSLPTSMGSIAGAARVWRAIRTFRQVREELRHMLPGQGDLAVLQYTETARRTGDDPSQVAAWVDEWMHRRPLKYLRLSRRSGLISFLTALSHAGIRTGVLSDYPAHAKLEALGLSQWFTLTLCTTDPDIGAFKPNPAGFLRACEHWGVAPHNVLYVGDRPDVDAVGAAGAGMPCAIISSGAWFRPQRIDGYFNVPLYRRLTRVLVRSGRA